MFILLETTEGRPVLVNLNHVRSVAVSNRDKPVLHLQFEGGSITDFKAVDGQGNPLAMSDKATERDLMRSFREMLAATQATTRP